jgi:hypothetical protein
MEETAGHVSDEVLIDTLYGLADNESQVRAHLRQCSVCDQRWKGLQETRAASVLREIPHDVLAVQRRKIYERMERPERQRARIWAPAAAAVALIAAGIFVQQTDRPETQVTPQITPQVAVKESTDTQLFAEAYSMEQSFEPSAADPIYGLFEEQN